MFSKAQPNKNSTRSSSIKFLTQKTKSPPRESRNGIVQKNPPLQQTQNKQRQSNSAQKAPQKIQKKNTYLPMPRKKGIIESKLDKLPNGCLTMIFQFALRNITEYVQMLRICRKIYYCLTMNEDIIRNLTKGRFDSNQLTNQELKQLLVRQAQNTQLIKYTEFKDKMKCLFQYGASKMNLPNKILDQLQFTCNVQISVIQKYFFNPKIYTRTSNFSTHLIFKVPLDKIPFKMDKYIKEDFKIRIEIKSQHLDLFYIVEKKYNNFQLLDDTIRQKAFNFIQDGNLLITYFDGDKYLLYMLFEISAIEIMNNMLKQIKCSNIWKQQKIIKQDFQKIKNHEKEKLEKIKQREAEKEAQSKPVLTPYQIAYQEHQQQLQQIEETKQNNNKKPPVKTHKTTFLQPKENLIQNYKYSSIQEYLNSQQDFEVIVNIHNGIKNNNVFTYTNTKAYPSRLYLNFNKVILLSWTNNSIIFNVPISERIQTEYTFYLDNKMGIKENIDDLLLADIIVKDRDNFLVIYSGFTYVFEKQQEVNNFDDQGHLLKECKVKQENQFCFSFVFTTKNGKNPISKGKYLEIECQSSIIF